MHGWSIRAAGLPHPAEIAVRVAAVAIVVLALNQIFARALIEVLVPLIRVAVELISDDFIILGTAIVRNGEALEIRTDLAHTVVVGEHLIYPLGWSADTSGWLQVTLTAGSVVHHVLLLWIVILAWPARTVRELLARLLVSLPFACILLFLAAPFTILAELWFPLHDDFDREAFWPLLAWSRFLMGGGALVLALVSGVLAIGAGARYASRSCPISASRPASPTAAA